jgi:subtilisin-like proprotein convertase family protein
VLGPIAIPDNDVVGVSSSVVADVPCAAVQSVQVRVDITHPFRGDLSIFLTSPESELVVLLAPSNDPTPDVHETFDVDIAAGQEASGEWVLTVIDDVPPDAGTLDRWSIGINRAAP